MGNNMTRLNTDNTRFVYNQTPSSIDHAYTNVPNKTTNMITHDYMIYDHKLLSLTYNTKEQIYYPQFIETRNRYKINRFNLLKGIENSQLYRVFHYTNPNIIANIIQVELGTIIDTIAPLKVKQYRKDYVPYIDSNTLNKIEENNLLLTDAITKYDAESWRQYRTNRNLINKLIKNKKQEYIKNKFNSN